MSASTVLLTEDAVDPRIWKIAAVVALGPLMSTVDSTAVNLSLSTLGRELHTPLITIQWVISGYLLALALMLPLSGWLVDRAGSKRVYIGCFAAFTVASLLCGAARSSTALIGSRVLQGMAGGLLAPMAQMVTARVAGRHFAKVVGIISVPVQLGPILGPTLAGFILQHASWRWIFFINLPLGILATVLAAWILPRDGSSTRSRLLDLPGFLLLASALVLLLHSLERLSANSTTGLSSLLELTISLALLMGFIVKSTWHPSVALIDLGLFRITGFSAAAITQFLFDSISAGGQMLLPLYLLTVQRISPEQTGMLLAPAGLGMLCSYPTMGALTRRFGLRRVSAVGSVAAFAATVPFALWSLPIHTTGLVLFLRGLGLGCISVPSMTAAYSAVPIDTIPMATTAINIAQRLGGPVATTAIAVFLHIMMNSSSTGLTQTNGTTHAFAATFVLLCAFHGASVFAALRLPLWPSRFGS